MARGDTTEFLDFTEKALDKVPLFVPVFVVGSLLTTGSFGWNNSGSAEPLHLGHNGVNVVGLVRNDMLCRVTAQYVQDGHAIVNLAAGKLQVQRINKRIDEGMNLGRQAAATAANGLSIAPPFVPAEC